MVRFLVEHGACVFAATLSDHETAADKCEEDEEGFEGCSEFLYGVQDKLGTAHGGMAYAVYDYDARQPDELSFRMGDALQVLRRPDDQPCWWWARHLRTQAEGYVPRNLLGVSASLPSPGVTLREEHKNGAQGLFQKLVCDKRDTKEACPRNTCPGTCWR